MKNQFCTRVLPLLLTSSLLLTACSKEKIPIAGERESYLSFAPAVKAESALSAEEVIIPGPVSSSNWDQVGGEPSHVNAPAALASKPKLVWASEVGAGSSENNTLISGIVVHGPHIFAMDAVGHVRCLDKNGKILWSTGVIAEESALGGGIAYANGKIFASTAVGEVVSLDAKTGKVVWTKNIGRPMRGAPAVYGDRLFVVTLNNQTVALDTYKGNILWEHTGVEESAGLLGAPTPAVDGNVVVVAYSSGEIYALHVENGATLWVDTLVAPHSTVSAASIAHIRARPIIDRNQVYAVSHSGIMACFDLATGARFWSKEIGGTRTPAVAGNYIFLVTNDNDIVCLKRDTGQVRWISHLPSLETTSWAGPIVAGDHLVLAGRQGEIAFVSPKDGKLVHKLSMAEGTFLSPVVADRSLYIYTDKGVILSYK